MTSCESYSQASVSGPKRAPPSWLAGDAQHQPALARNVFTSAANSRWRWDRNPWASPSRSSTARPGAARPAGTSNAARSSGRCHHWRRTLADRSRRLARASSGWGYPSCRWRRTAPGPSWAAETAKQESGIRAPVRIRFTSTSPRCRPHNFSDQLGQGEVATWAPSSSTLISGPREGILIDALLTFENADQIATWAKSFGKKITGAYITHGHSDHWLGLARLLEHFPTARGYAAPEVVFAPFGRPSSTRPASTGRRASSANSPRRPWCPRC